MSISIKTEQGIVKVANVGVPADTMRTGSYDPENAVKDAGGIVAYVESKLNETITSAIEGSY